MGLLIRQTMYLISDVNIVSIKTVLTVTLIFVLLDKYQFKVAIKCFVVLVKMDLLKSMWIGFLMSASHVYFGRRNVLFLVADDMRPELGAYYGKDFPSPVHLPIHSPNLDKLAAKSLLLKRAYCQRALCSPSRTSLLTGRRPDTTHVYDLQTYWRKSGGNFTTIPEHFKNMAIFL